jgi:hypothetical protein
VSAEGGEKAHWCAGREGQGSEAHLCIQRARNGRRRGCRSRVHRGVVSRAILTHSAPFGPRRRWRGRLPFRSGSCPRLLCRGFALLLRPGARFSVCRGRRGVGRRPGTRGSHGRHASVTFNARSGRSGGRRPEGAGGQGEARVALAQAAAPNLQPKRGGRRGLGQQHHSLQAEGGNRRGTKKANGTKQGSSRVHVQLGEATRSGKQAAERTKRHRKMGAGARSGHPPC